MAGQMGHEKGWDVRHLRGDDGMKVDGRRDEEEENERAWGRRCGCGTR